MITDAQVHLWQANRPDRPWNPKMKPHVPEPMTGERMMRLMDEAGIDRAVVSPPGIVMGRPPDYALEVAAKFPNRFRVMPWFEPGRPGEFERLPLWLSTPHVCSLRLNLNDAPEVDDTKVMEMLDEGLLEPLFDGCERYCIPMAVYCRNGCGVMESAIRRHPGMVVIVDHFNWAVPDADRERKLTELDQLARYPNVYVKVSSMPKLTRSPPPYADLEPLIRRALASFGACRLMWGSDQTQIMAMNNGSYRDNVDIIRAAEYLSEEDKHWILNGTAAKVFNWPSP